MEFFVTYIYIQYIYYIEYIYIYIWGILLVISAMSGKGWERLASSHSGLSDLGTNQGCVASASIAK